MIRKWIGVTLLGVISTMGLVGCGGATGEDYDLVIWEDQDKGIGIKEAVANFEELHDVKIKVEEKAYTNQIEDIRLDGPAGIGPDILTIPADQIGTAKVEGLLKELYVDDSVKGLYTQTAMQSQIIDGQVFGLPKAVETLILFYNKDLISEEELPETIDEWYETSLQYREDDLYGLLALWDQIYYAFGLISPYGGYIFDYDTSSGYDVSRIGLNNDGAIEAMSYLQQFYGSGAFPAGIIGEQGIDMLEALFIEGQAAAVISGPWNLEPFQSAGINYGVAPLPLLNNGERMSSFNNVKGYSISSFTENADLAEKLLLFITNEENSRIRYVETLEVPAVQSLAEDEALMQDEGAKAVAVQSIYSVMMPNIPEMSEVWTPVDAALQTIANGRAEPIDALNEAVEQIARQIEVNHTSQQ